MSFDRKGRFFGIILLAVTTALLPSCGLFGKKKSKSRVISPQSDGCYNELSPKIDRFFKGTISEQEWLTTFDCVNDQVAFFKRFVRPSSEKGYTEGDIGSLTRRFFITNHTVSDFFISAVFKLKASTVGGPIDVVTEGELDEFVKLSNFLRDESLELLPRIRSRAENPTVENQLALADALDRAGADIGDYFNAIKGTTPLQKSVLIPFVEELVRLTNGDNTLVSRYATFVENMKVAVAGGSDSMIEPSTWSILIRECASFGGLYVAFSDRAKIRYPKTSEETRFYLELVKRAERHTDRILTRRGGSIALKEFSRLIDSAPREILEEEKLVALKADLRNIVNFALRSRVPGAMDTHALHNLMNLFEEGMVGQIHLENVFESIPETVGVGAFEEAANRYMSTAKSEIERQQVNALVSTARNFQGLFPEEGDMLRISRETWDLRTRNHLVKMQWFRIAIRYMLSVYGTGPNNSGEKKDLRRLIGHFDHILRAWKKVHPKMSTEEMTDRRFREANLFMPNSNGDETMSEDEGTYYVAFLFSAGTLSGRIYHTIVDERRLCPVIGRDDLGEPGVDPTCFRNAYFGNVQTFWRNFPGLLNAYQNMSQRDRELLQESMEMSARFGGGGNKPLGRYDMDAFAGLPHFVENTIERFDLNQNAFLSKDELFRTGSPRGAYSVFRGELKKFSGVKQEWLLKCAFSYLVKFGREPKGIFQKAQLLAHCAFRRFGDLAADRVDFYKIIGMISASAEKKTEAPARIDYFRSVVNQTQRELPPDELDALLLDHAVGN